MGSSATTVRVLSAGAQLDAVRKAGKPGDELWLTAAELHEVSGWALKPEGLCKAGACVPLGSEARAHADGDLVRVSGLWPQLGRPLLHDAARSTWMLGEAAEDRARQLASLEAPDFTLPDIEGVLHSLSDFRGKKVLLATWASW
jgi:hypothetical protein